MQTLKDAALEYAEQYGLAVHPLVTRDKRPATPHGFRDATTDADQIAQAWAARPSMNIGAAMGKASGGIICIDIDVDDAYDGNETVYEWETEHGRLPETATAVTGRGGTHLYYRVDREIKPSANASLHVDIRGDGSYVVLPPSVHPNGQAYYWDLDPADVGFADADDNVYAFIEHVRPGAGAERFDPSQDVEKGGRDAAVFRLCCSLWAKNLPRDVIEAAAHQFNAEHCKPPLPRAEVDKKVRSATKYPPGPSERFRKEQAEGEKVTDAPTDVPETGQEGESPQLTKGAKVFHNLFARHLIDHYGACFVDGAPAIWDGSRYAVGWLEIQRAIVRIVDDVKKRDQVEICHYLTLTAPRRQPSDPSLIGFANGVLDIGTGAFMDYTPDMVITNIIPHRFDWNAQDDDVDALLERISCGDPAIRANLEEVIGLCMYRSNEYATCPVLIGTGANGKSTYINMLRNVLGDENVSSMDIATMGERFQAASLAGKLANLGDDISNERLRGNVLAVFKKVVTGEPIRTDVKGGAAFEFKPYCTPIFSCNEMPSLGDSTDGMMRRLFPIPFEARFSAADAGYDPQIGRKMRTERAAERLCVLGIYGLQRVVFNNGMSANEQSTEMRREIATSNNNVLAWMEDEERTPDSIDGLACSTVYDAYRWWCQGSGAQPCGKNKFGRELKALYGFKSASVPDGSGSSVRVYKRKAQA